MVRSSKPVVVPIECPQPKTIAPTAPKSESSRAATDGLDGYGKSLALVSAILLFCFSGILSRHTQYRAGY